MRNLTKTLALGTCLFLGQLTHAQFSGITGVGDGINLTLYGNVTSGLSEIRPYGTGTTTVTVAIDFWNSGFNGGVNLTSATLYYKTNSGTFGTANNGTWTTVNGSLSAVASSDNDRATFSLSGITPGTDIMYYIRASDGSRDGYAYPD